MPNRKKIARIVTFLVGFTLTVGVSRAGTAEVISGMKGLLGVSQDLLGTSEAVVEKLKQAGVNAVFVDQDRELIEALKQAGIKVFFSVGVFGGTKLWEQHPELRPVTDQGRPMGTMDGFGGINPAVEWYRSRKLQEIENLLTEYPVDGIWLDFIRYPGVWERPEPLLTRTDFSHISLAKFSRDRQITFPSELESLKDKAGWLLAHHEAAWNTWRREEIVDMVRSIAQVVKATRPDALLGVFAVPWRPQDFDGAVIWALAQDIERIAPYVDAISPMVYHEMCARPVDWISEITADFSRRTGKPVYPIIQASDVRAEELGEAFDAAKAPPSKGAIVFMASHLDEDKWRVLEKK